MRVTLDATPLSLSTGGLARYTAELARALAEQFPEDHYEFVSDQSFIAPAGVPSNLTCGRGPSGWIERRWWLWGVRSAARRADVFHGVNYTVPWLRLTPAVLTLHDLSPWKTQPDAPWADRAWRDASLEPRWRAGCAIAFHLANMIVTPTEAVRRQAIAELRVHPDRIVATPLAADHFRPPAALSAVDPAKTKPYFLFAGMREPRKNVHMLIDAWREAARTHPCGLVIAGPCRAGFDLPVIDGLRVAGEVPDQELAALYSDAAGFLYPSSYEGFGLPALEAMQCGCATVVSRDEALREVTGAGAIHLDASDARAWTEAMCALASRPDLRAEWRERGRLRARDYSWKKTARLTREVYEAARRRA